MTTPTRTCPHCGAVRPPLGRFCGACGQEFPDSPPVPVRGPKGGIGIGSVALAVVAVGLIGWLALGRNSPPGAGPTQPVATRTPAPTAKPWSLSVTDNRYTSETTVGDNVTVTIEIANGGSQVNPGTNVNFSELDKYADLFSCSPECTKEDLPGLGPSAYLPGVPPGETATYTIEFVAAKVGAADWTMCVYDSTSAAPEQVWCGSATTVIR